MKILAIDDQQLILMSLVKRLEDAGLEVNTASTAEQGMKLFDSYKPDLVILDINMPYISGLEVVKYIRQKRKSQTPVLIMSGKTGEETIKQAYELGINDFMKKPISLNEVLMRIQSLLFINPLQTSFMEVHQNQYLQKYCVGVVIPCYNEENRISGKVFREFLQQNRGYHFCFVNDGSTDNTLAVLEQLRTGYEDSISIVNCVKNGGKAEAVRQGTLHLLQDRQLDYIGYLDADLSTDLSDFNELVNTLESSDYQIVSGSRIHRMGATITKQSARKIISKTINLIIQGLLGMGFKDTQCGAKVMDRNLAAVVLTRSFITKWLFDVEIFVRMRKIYGKERAKSLICEQPLKRWIHADGSKLSMRDSVTILGQLTRIAWHYRMAS
ncbi:MAG: response regulator [Flavobacteriaceae bacterium]|nr:response regulator [Flavobacteriaceae bacterium]MDH3795588.1 response regulator [Flavobacteriaceae bacterium]